MVAAAPTPARVRVAPAARTVHLRVLRAFLLKGQRVEVGSVVEIERGAGMGLVTALKAVVVAPPAPMPAPAAATRPRGRKAED